MTPSKPHPFFNRNLIAVLHDAVMAAASFVCSLYLRLGSDQFEETSDYLFLGTALFTLTCVMVCISMRQYRGLWRYASMRDMVTLVKSVTLSIALFAALMFFINRLEGIPRSALFINWMLLLFMLAGPRFLYRAIKDRTLFWRMSLKEVPKIPVLLIGANNHAEQFIRDMRRDPDAPYEVVGIVSDNPAQIGNTIHRVAIYGNTSALDAIIRKLDRKAHKPQKMILTDDTMAGEQVQKLLGAADALGIPLARLPKLSEFKTGFSDTPDVRPILLEDLLGRPQQVLDRDSMRALVADKDILITGAGGTIGAELTRQIASYAPRTLTLLDSSEFNLYQIEREMRGLHTNLSLSVVLADIRDNAHMNSIFTAKNPVIVFHAAAVKHVPMAESNIEETILTNVFGTACLAEICMRHHVATMVMISTDKAVNPTNVMGASKRLAESLCQAIAATDTKTRFVTVRFGNVLGSTGSVVPLFQEQLTRGGPLTVTHPDMTRYFMTVREAVELVLQAAVLAGRMDKKREAIFVLDMGKPVKIVELALQMIRLAGLRPEIDIKIEYTGLRPGEKLYEELFHSAEDTERTTHAGIFLASPRFTDINTLRAYLERLHAACSKRSSSDALVLLAELVPEFAHASLDSAKKKLKA